eukprot:TRINITY_DN93523_c0_g1_i1.p1 TRINITY_DN93523_c0_g1~~TRINITY_DN93523_c0_g1_i1.p1  ORF type:complete len:334 (+),score=65.23 TRINITY_DN93523_c0_g1_i1:66-1067(+)
MSHVLNKFRKTKKDKPRILPVSDAKVSDNYVMKHVLGRGAHSMVKLATHKRTRENVAVKIIDKKTVGLRIDLMKQEVDILTNINHPNVVNLKEVFEDDEKVYMIMELMEGGELFDCICNDFPEGYSERHSSVIMAKIFEAIRYLHSMGIIHRDLKPENLLFSSKDPAKSEIKISDFGLAKICSDQTMVRTACGSPNYVAPEVLTNQGYTFSCDLWSAGVVLYALLCGFLPFSDDSWPKLFSNITTGTYHFPSPNWDHISAEAKDLVRHLLVVDPGQRFTAEQALHHPWIVAAATQQTAAIPNITQTMKRLRQDQQQASRTSLAAIPPPGEPGE